MNKMILVILLAAIFVYARDNYSLSSHGENIYVLDGFSKDLSVYGKNKDLIKKINLKNISPSGFFDFFIKYDMFLSYLVDSEKGTVYVLDENYTLKKQSDILATHGIGIYKKIFPTGYNSLIIASSEKDRIYSLTNNIMKEILSFEKEFTDIFFDGNDIYVLTGNEISLYSAEGIFKSKLSLNSDKVFSGIFSENGNIMITTSGEITLLSISERKNKIFKIDDNSYPVLASSMIYYFNPDSLKLKSVVQ